MKNKLELCKKLNELVQKGVGGEKLNATKMLNEIMKKYSITESDLELVKVGRHKIRIPSKYRKLFLHIVWKAAGNETKIFVEDNSKTNLYIETTSMKFLYIESMYRFYKKSFDKSLKDIERAFILKNELHYTGNIKDDSPEKDRDDVSMLRSMMGGIKKEKFPDKDILKLG